MRNKLNFAKDENSASCVVIVDELLTLDVRVVMPGHGPLSGKAELDELRAELRG